MIFNEPEAGGLLRRLAPKEGILPMILDTDTYNEVDDQFALAYALASEERLDVKAVYAAPFFAGPDINDRSTSPADGMEKSYNEILRLFDKMKTPPKAPVFRGSQEFLKDADAPVVSPAASDLVQRAKEYSPDNPLYVVAIGAITNIASAILSDPSITDRIVIVWLGGHPLHWHNNYEFNLMQDYHAASVIFDCGAAVVQVPCFGVASHMLTTKYELIAHIGGKSTLCDALVELFAAYKDDHFAYAKELWDISTIGRMVNPEWAPSVLEHSPVITAELTWSRDPRRHMFRTVYSLNRNAIFADMFRKIVHL